MQDYKYTSTEVMTAISAKHWDFITQDNLSVKEAVEFLKNGMQIRTFKDNICQIYQSYQMKKYQVYIPHITILFLQYRV